MSMDPSNTHRSFSFRAVAVVFVAMALSATTSAARHLSAKECPLLMIWIASQWMYPLSVRNSVEAFVWERWEALQGQRPVGAQPVPVVNVQEHDSLLEYLELTYGATAWRRQPILFKQMWTREQLRNLPDLSLEGLLRSHLEIPYFTDARIPRALTPDAKAPISSIVHNITEGRPHKIGSQLLVKQYPKLIEQVAPIDLVTELFGDHFSVEAVQSSGPWGMLPAQTTVPLFVANGRVARKDDDNGTDATDLPRHPSTALHCEPIGNVAVQLSGVKKWTLVQPDHSFRLFPAISKDGRAFFASHKQSIHSIPRYTVETQAGDALWVPTWTWHAVHYVESDDVSISASLFHFRPVDFISRNPLFAWLSMPAIILEAIGYNTQ